LDTALKITLRLPDSDELETVDVDPATGEPIDEVDSDSREPDVDDDGEGSIESADDV